MTNPFILTQVVTDDVLARIDSAWHKHETTPLAQMFRAQRNGQEFYTLSQGTTVAAVIMVKNDNNQCEVLDYFGPNFDVPKQDVLEEIGRLAAANAWAVPVNVNTKTLRQAITQDSQVIP